jgi:paraquat-inducible protein B
MRSILNRSQRFPLAVLLAVALIVPLMGGCSTLGIATLDDLNATETRLRTSSNATATRIDDLEKDKADMQQTLTQVTASLDTLNSRFERASVWLQNMNLDTISADAQRAQQAAMSAESRAAAFLTHYIEWMKAQQTLLQEQIAALEAKMESPETGDSGSGDEGASPADSGDDDESSGGGGS